MNLALVLNELNVPQSIDSVTQRISLQKIVYMAQVAGLRLGYKYSWYRYGPYCTELADTYYQMAANASQLASHKRDLKPETIEKLTRVKKAMLKPQDFPLETNDWYELLASVHFLFEELALPAQQARKLLKEQKPRLEPFIEMAVRELKACSLWKNG